MTKPYLATTRDLSGFDLIGYVQPDGKIKLGSGLILSEFPKEVKLLGNVYTLEAIKKNDSQGTLPEDHDGKHLVWGLYA